MNFERRLLLVGTALLLGIGAGACRGNVVSRTHFHVGGTVSGLVPFTEVALRTTRGDTVTVTANGAFQFENVFVDGSDYTVEVETQPAGMVCNVSNASGTVDGADVSSVLVVCETENQGPYTVGGTYTGLTIGTTVVLQNNGGSDLSIIDISDTSGTFTFPGVYVDGETYEITVLTQPLAQECVVSNGSGTIAGSNVTDVLVVCSQTGNPTYTVSGTVTGLDVGSAVVLQNNGGHDVQMFDNGTFLFDVALSSGEPYSVTVRTQPSSQSCIVTSGAGTIANANVTNVTVTCGTTPMHNLGGAVAGLGAGRSVVLRNVGASSLAVSANGAFTFASPIPEGVDYAVTVHTQPAGQLCSVSNATGTMGNGDVSDVAVTCVNRVAGPGQLDPAFGGGAGFATHDGAGGGIGTDLAQAITFDSSGRIVAAGYTTDTSGTQSLAVWRFSASGELDTTFGGTGFVTHPGAGTGGFAQTVGAWVGIDANNRIVVVGWSIAPDGGSWGAAVWRFNPDGTPDNSFNGTGFVRDLSFEGFNYGVAGAIDSNGRILVTGFVYPDNTFAHMDMAIWRFTPGGTLDTTLNGAGYVTYPRNAGGNGEDVGSAIVLDAAGNILVSGYSTNADGNQDMALWRYLANGTPDTTFNGTGFVTHDNAGGAGGNDSGNALFIDSSSRILVTGWSPSSVGRDDMAVWRFNANGTLDTAFNGTGYFVHNGAAGANELDEGRAIRVDSSGRVLVVGTSTTLAGDTDMCVWRLTASGALDTTFNGTGFFTHDGYASSDDAGRALRFDGSGNLLVSGFSRNTSGNLDLAIWRLFP